MATGTTPITAEEYLRTSYQPNCEYIDGALRQKPMPTRKHGSVQIRIGRLLSDRFADFDAESEVTVRIRPEKYFVPDLIVQRRDHMQDPYPTEPVHLCIEILSPDDRLSEVLAKCEDYHAWGVETAWIVDPESRRAWEYRKGQLLTEVPAAGSLRAEGIEIPLAEVFSGL